MRVVELSIQNLRNLDDVRLRPAKGLNWIYGSNGAGKTSVLEAMAILARGRSFRKGGPRAWIGPAGSQTRVFARVAESSGTVRLGIERSVGGWRGMVNGEGVGSLAEMSRHLPLVVFEPGAHELVEGGPEERRRYLDWGVFHVEHRFLEAWRRFARILKQRNAALRDGARGAVLDSLDPGYAEAAHVVSGYRERYAAALDQEVRSIQPALMAEMPAVTLGYSRGWRSDGELLELLREGRDRDREQGFTHQGPHRADLLVRLGGRKVRHGLSRGQQKQVALILLMGQYRLWQEQLEQTPVFLLDDVESELDEAHRQRVMCWLGGDRGQVWITGTERPGEGRLPPGAAPGMFHVEQGRIVCEAGPEAGE